MLLENLKISRVSDAVAAGTTTINGTAVDMQGFDGVMFLTLFGAIVTGAVTSLKGQQGALANGSDGADLAGTSVSVADGDDNKVAILDIYRPTDRYVRPVVLRATQNATVDGIIAIQYNGRVNPQALTASLVAASKALGSPALGTP